MPKKLHTFACARMTTPDQTLALAPAVGTGITKVIVERLLADPEIVPLMVEAAKGGLQATTPRRWDKDTSKWLSDPDYRVRIQTLFGLFAQADGEPIKRVIHEFKRTGIDPLAVLDSPAAIEAAERMIAGAKAHARKTASQAKRAEPVTVDVEG